LSSKKGIPSSYDGVPFFILVKKLEVTESYRHNKLDQNSFITTSLVRCICGTQASLSSNCPRPKGNSYHSINTLIPYQKSLYHYRMIKNVTKWIRQKIRLKNNKMQTKKVHEDKKHLIYFFGTIG